MKEHNKIKKTQLTIESNNKLPKNSINSINKTNSLKKNSYN